jgi:hypothetical protein
MKSLTEMRNFVLNVREKAVPFLGICTVDPNETMRSISTWVESKSPILIWDSARGFTPYDKRTSEMLKSREIADFTLTQFDSTAAMVQLLKLPEMSIIFALNAQDWMMRPPTAQAICNLRDDFTQTGKNLIFLGPNFTGFIPPQLTQDIIVIREPLPTSEELRSSALTLLSNAEPPLPVPDEITMGHILNAGRGLGRFAFEQVLALGMTEKGISLDALWEMKSEMIKQVRGLSFNKSTLTFDDLGGLDHIKDEFAKIFAGTNPPEILVFIDELEKHLTTSDSSGVGKDQLGVLLTAMEENNWTGMVFLGPQGGGKTAVATAVGNSYQIKTLNLDLGGAKGSLVGQSEGQIRAAIDTILAMGGSQVRFLATCNSFESLPPELLRRFSDGFYFFDLADAEMKKKIWAKNLERYKITDTKLPVDEHYAASNIRDVCRKAAEYKCSLEDAARSIVPVGRSSATNIEACRRSAEGVFLDANLFGVYDRTPTEAVKQNKGRRIQQSERLN